MMRYILLLGWVSIGMIGCRGEEIPPGPIPDYGCDTSYVSFSQDVYPILQQYGCLDCHGGKFPQGQVSLVGYDNVIIYVQSGQLLGSIKHLQGYAPMPSAQEKMAPCDIAKIEKWINSGAPNN